MPKNSHKWTPERKKKFQETLRRKKEQAVHNDNNKVVEAANKNIQSAVTICDNIGRQYDAERLRELQDSLYKARTEAKTYRDIIMDAMTRSR